MGDPRPRFTAALRRRLARAAKKLSRMTSLGIDPFVTPDTLVRWCRKLFARRYDGTRARKMGRPMDQADGSEHYHLEGKHRGLGNELIEPPGEVGPGRVACRERLGGMLRHYDRMVA